MRLDHDEAWSVLLTTDHGVLSTVHPTRGVDAVPVVFVPFGVELLIPIDTVKAKSTTRLQRIANLERDPRCVLLVDHYDDDWSRLWWVRVHALASIRDDELAPAFRSFDAYQAPGAIAAVIELRPTEVTGWRA